jgi:hypothetical protein
MVNNQQEGKKIIKYIREKKNAEICAPEMFLRETVRRTG